MKHNFHISTLFRILTIFCTLLPISASAFLITTDAKFTIGGVDQLADPKSGPPPGTIVSNVNPDSSEAFIPFSSRSASADAINFSGISAVSVEGVFASGQSDRRELSAQATFSENCTNSSAFTEEFFYNFFVFAPVLEIWDFAGVSSSNPEAPTVSYGMDILVDGTSLWSSSAVLHGGDGGHTLLETGIDLGGTYFSTPGVSFGYEFDDFNDTISLGSYASGNSCKHHPKPAGICRIVKTA